MELKQAVDNFSTVTFTAPYESGDPVFRETFRPFSYKSLEVSVNNERLFNGQLIGVAPQAQGDRVSVDCSGYALPAQLADAHMPASSFPLEFNNMTIAQIATTLCEPFGVEVQVEGAVGTAFRRVALKPEQTPHEFLSELARQRGLILSNTADGKLRIFRSATSGTVQATMAEGSSPLVSVTPTFNPQSYKSEITGLASTKSGQDGSRYTVQNPHGTTLRPLSFTAQDVTAADLPEATRAKAGRMFGNLVSYVVELPTWRTPGGSLYAPNTFIKLYAPSAFVTRWTTLLVRDVILKQHAGKTTCSLGLVLPGAFSGSLPTELPWD